MDQKIVDLYDSFTHGGMNRRQFLDRLTDLAGSSAAAVALLPMLQNDYARAAIVAPDDARLAIDTVSYEAPGTRIDAKLARLKSKGKRPAVIVIHENRGPGNGRPLCERNSPRVSYRGRPRRNVTYSPNRRAGGA